MDFNRGLSKGKTINRDGLTKGVVVYDKDSGIFTVKVKDEVYSVNAYSFLNTKVIYSKPNNDKHPDWTKKKVTLANEERFHQIAKYWSAVKPNLKVKGIILDKRFIIIKY